MAVLATFTASASGSTPPPRNQRYVVYQHRSENGPCTQLSSPNTMPKTCKRGAVATTTDSLRSASWLFLSQPLTPIQSQLPPQSPPSLQASTAAPSSNAPPMKSLVNPEP